MAATPKPLKKKQLKSLGKEMEKLGASKKMRNLSKKMTPKK